MSLAECVRQPENERWGWAVGWRSEGHSYQIRREGAPVSHKQRLVGVTAGPAAAGCECVSAFHPHDNYKPKLLKSRQLRRIHRRVENLLTEVCILADAGETVIITKCIDSVLRGIPPGICPCVINVRLIQQAAKINSLTFLPCSVFTVNLYNKPTELPPKFPSVCPDIHVDCNMHS